MINKETDDLLSYLLDHRVTAVHLRHDAGVYGAQFVADDVHFYVNDWYKLDRVRLANGLQLHPENGTLFRINDRQGLIKARRDAGIRREVNALRKQASALEATL